MDFCGFCLVLLYILMNDDDDDDDDDDPTIKIDVTNFRGCLCMISLLEIDLESCSDHFGGVESDF